MEASLVSSLRGNQIGVEVERGHNALGKKYVSLWYSMCPTIYLGMEISSTMGRESEADQRRNSPVF